MTQQMSKMTAVCERMEKAMDHKVGGVVPTGTVVCVCVSLRLDSLSTINIMYHDSVPACEEAPRTSRLINLSILPAPFLLRLSFLLIYSSPSTRAAGGDDG